MPPRVVIFAAQNCPTAAMVELDMKPTMAGAVGLLTSITASDLERADAT